MSKRHKMCTFGTRLVAAVLLLSSWLPANVVSFSTLPTTPQQSTSTPEKMNSPQGGIPLIQSTNDELLRDMQRKYRPIAASFQPSKFNPHPLLTNCHLQTISGVFLRKNPDCAYISDSGFRGIANVVNGIMQQPSKTDNVCTYWDERQRITTSCEEDFFTVDIKYAGERKTQYQSEDSKGLVVLLHGLESNSNSSLSTDMSQSYVQDGFDVVCINFRGCCGSPNKTPGGYHLGFTDDVKHFLKLISEMSELDKRPIYLSGFSLGANVVIKLLGELGDSAMSLYNVKGAACTGAPFDAERNIKFVDSPGFNRQIYGGSFLKSMKKRAQEQLDLLCDGDPSTEVFDYKAAMSATTIAEFENAFLPSIYGFQDNIDYYRSTSCYYFLPGVAVPLYILNSGDDPFFDPDFFPIEESIDGGANAPIKMERTEHGGHLGYMFHQSSDNEKKRARSTSWMPTELARFIGHVHSYNEDSINSS